MTISSVAPDLSPETAVALKLWVTLSRAQAAVAALASKSVERHDLTLAEFAILEALYSKGPLLVGEVQRKVLVSSGGITYLVDRLVKRGLVERLACPTDRRARYAALTDKGKGLIARVFAEHVAALEDALAGLGTNDQRRAAELLKRLGLYARSRADAGTAQ
ncbi:MAG TPA: MarR family transcriptional regulator [Gemmatimonadales bacterium]|nr:MarR family transcriptional regulator [Gemmatimonadales bacterium]